MTDNSTTADKNSSCPVELCKHSLMTVITRAHSQTTAGAPVQKESVTSAANQTLTINPLQT